MFFTCSNLFYHKFEEQILNQNKLTIYSIIEKGIKEAIRNALPMKEILLNYNTQKYERKHKEKEEKPYINISEFDESTKKSEESNDFDEVQTSEKDKKESEKVEVKEKEPEIRMVDMSGIDMNKGQMKYFMNEIAKKKEGGVEIVKSNSAKDIVNEILEV